MKNNSLLLGSALLTGAVLLSSSLYLNNIAHYTPRTIQKNIESEENEDATGAAQWLFDIQKDPATGTIDPMAILRARAEAQQLAGNSSRSSALGLNWQELGPDNVGGRTRAILIDKNNPNKMFAGGVAGGLWVSTDAGSNWNIVAGFDQQPNLAICSMTQSANGDIYVGTGEGAFYSTTGTGSQGILGGGIYKSTNDGATFTLLSSTIPVPNNTSNYSGTAFIGVAELASDPVNPNRIYAATKYGLQMTNNGGVSWFHPIRQTTGVANTGAADDVDVASDGTVIANLNNKLYISPNGDSATFTSTSVGLPTPSTISRTEFAIAPSDPNFMYAITGKLSNDLLEGVYQSTDKGANWVKIGVGGSVQFEPFLSAFGQSYYDMAIAVNPTDKYKIFAAGVTLWTWRQTSPSTPGQGQWLQAATNGLDIPGYPYFVHSDIHEIRFKNANTLYIGCDGGIFRSLDNGSTYQSVNSGYNVTQFYAIAFEGDNAYGTGVIGGAQDNGTKYIHGTGGNTSRSAVSINGGDGFETEISFLNPNASFSSVYYGDVDRHSTKGTYGNGFYPSKIVTGTGKASFVTPMALYETKSSTNSIDSVQFINERVSQIIATGNGVNKHFKATLALPQSSASISPGSVIFKAGSQTVYDGTTGTNNLIGNISGSTNSLDYATHVYDFNFATAPTNGELISVSFDVLYYPGSTITIQNPNYKYPLFYVTPGNIMPNDTVMIYDSIQSKFAVGFSGAVWMTKGALDFSKIPDWYKIASISGTAEELAWTADGDILYVGTSGGNLYRIANLSKVKDSLTGDVGSPGTTKVVTTLIGGFSRFITSISVDPLDNNKVAIALGGYNQSANVYYSTTAATCSFSSGTTNFALKQGTLTTKLPSMPVYAVMIEKIDPKRVLVGTEYGVYSTDDITATNPVWSSENGTTGLLPNVPVFDLRQQRLDGSLVNNPFVIYAGTHGRGAWKSETFKGPVTVGIKEPKGSKTTIESGLNVYPNPMNDDGGFVAFKLNSADNLVISIYSLQGKLVNTFKTDRLNAGDQKVAINTEELAKGTYFVNVTGASMNATSKFVVTK